MIKWISVKDRLPDIDKIVLCLIEVGLLSQRYKKIMESKRYKMANCDIKCFIGENRYNKVTHWAEINYPEE